MPDLATGPKTLRPEHSSAPEAALDIAQLRDRGWTRQMVNRFLGSPDARRPATQGTGGRPAELYSASRVRDAERLIAFSEARRTAIERSELARRSQQQRRISVLQFASRLELALPDLRIDDVIRNARSGPHSVADSARSDDRDRAVRYLLGILAESSRSLDVFQGQPGIRAARSLLLTRQLALIISRYPALADSCHSVQLRNTHSNETTELSQSYRYESALGQAVLRGVRGTSAALAMED